MDSLTQQPDLLQEIHLTQCSSAGTLRFQETILWGTPFNVFFYSLCWLSHFFLKCWSWLTKLISWSINWSWKHWPSTYLINLFFLVNTGVWTWICMFSTVIWPCLLPPQHSPSFFLQHERNLIVFTASKTEMISTGPLTSCVTVNELLNTPEFQFSDVKNLGNISISLRLKKWLLSMYWRKNTSHFLTLTLVACCSFLPLCRYSVSPQDCFLAPSFYRDFLADFLVWPLNQFVFL